MAHSNIGLPPDSTGKKLHTETHIVDGTEVHNQVFCLGDHRYSERIQRLDEYGAATVRFSGGGMEFDSFGKSKVSQEITMSHFIPEYDMQEDKFNTLTNGTTLMEYVPNEKSIRFGVGPDIGDKITRTSKMYHKYTAGISNTILMTVNPYIVKEGVTKRWGLFDEFNGLFFEQRGLDQGVVVRSYTSGTPVDTYISQSEFNGDKVDGTGVSGIIVDPNKSQIFWLDFQWLGVGAVRFGLVAPDGSKIIMHTVENANNNITVYMSSANLPIRYEIFNSVATGSASEIKIHTATVIHNSSNSYFGGEKYSSGTIDAVPITDQFKSVISVKQVDIFKNKINNSVAMPVTLNIWSDKLIIYSIQKKATFSNTPNYSEVHPESSVLVSTDVELETPGILMYSGILDATSGKFDLKNVFDYLGEHLNKDEEYTILVKCVNPLNEGSVIVGLGWEEMKMA